MIGLYDTVITPVDALMVFENQPVEYSTA
jgi:hypothetical protein